MTLVLVAVSCQGRAERALLDRFFDASRLRDKTLLSSFATVIFEPLEDGIVTTFEIVRISPEEASGAGESAILTKQVTIEAPVRQPDGRTVEKRIVVTIERPLSGRRWTITGLAAFPFKPS